MLEAGRPGESLPYQQLILPLARLTKAYCVVLNRFGGVGPIPEGMSATQGLRASKYERDHEVIAQRVLVMAEQFKREKRYFPPYWELLKLARASRGQP